MWNRQINNYICNYLSEYRVQKKHVERVLSAKEIINNKKSPYYPKFLKLKLSKQQMEEDKNNKIKEENKILFYKIINAEMKPSLYSQIFKTKRCPSFDTNLIYFKRVKKELKNYEENIRLYNKIEKVKSFYENKNLTQRNKDINKNIKKLHKSILELQPSLLFLSPQATKKQIEKYKQIKNNISKSKRCKSCCIRIPSNIYNKNKKKSHKELRNEKEKKTISSDSTLNKFSTLNGVLPRKKSKKENKENNKIIEKNLNNLKETIKKIKEKESKNKSIKNDKNNKKLNLSFDKNNSTNKMDNPNEKEKPKMKKIKYGLKRNSSEINIFS